MTRLQRGQRVRVQLDEGTCLFIILNYYHMINEKFYR